MANENLNHKFPNITLTNELHKLAQSTTHIALLKSRIPAATKDIMIRTTAVLPCKIIVAIVPIHMDLDKVFVVFCISILNEFVVTFLIVSSNRNTHNKNNPNHQTNLKILSNINSFKYIKYIKL